LFSKIYVAERKSWNGNQECCFYRWWRLISSIPELNYQAIDKLQQGGVPDKVSWMKPSLRGRLRLVKLQAQERNLTIEDLNQSIRSKWVILWAEV